MVRGSTSVHCHLHNRELLRVRIGPHEAAVEAGGLGLLGSREASGVIM